ncbi:hypothetical protein ACR82Z_03205 [Mycoplasma sp. 6243]|uniref:hypothetical protein n=1 Tax=Mycoplasma sp. 6243 TaxID=3440865 RepID=UPI003EBCE2E6
MKKKIKMLIGTSLFITSIVPMIITSNINKNFNQKITISENWYDNFKEFKIEVRDSFINQLSLTKKGLMIIILNLKFY